MFVLASSSGKGLGCVHQDSTGSGVHPGKGPLMGADQLGGGGGSITRSRIKNQASALTATELTISPNQVFGVWKNGGNGEHGEKWGGMGESGGKWGIMNKSRWKT